MTIPPITQESAPPPERPTLPQPASARQIAVIINPMAGLKDEAERIIRTYCDALPDCAIRFHFTEGSGDARKFAYDAARDGAALVVAYGGDGTITEVADGLRETGVPMAILPGGTANVMSVELGIPLRLEAALDLAFIGPNQPRWVDMGLIDQQPFLLRAGIGYEAEFSATAPRAAKRERGRLAYFEHALNRLRKLRPARYVITTDGEMHVVRGITCMICNSAHIGVGSLQLVYQSSVSDGLLDVIVIESLSLRSLLRLALGVLRGVLPGREGAAPTVHHWQAKQVVVEFRPRQLVAYDGEKLKHARRVSAQVIPQAVQIIVPAAEGEGTEARA
jgi:YegS/Rv2252/BmrU family lipid kinase